MIIGNNRLMFAIVNEFARCDKNHDGLLSTEEIHNGFISQIDWIQVPPEQFGQLRAQLVTMTDDLVSREDQDGDSAISLWEAMAAVKLVDDNGNQIDGFTQEEIDYIHNNTNTTPLFRLTSDDGTVWVFDQKARIIGLENITEDIELPYLPGVTFAAGSDIFVDYIDGLDNAGDPVAYSYISHVNLSKDTEIDGKTFEGDTTVEFFPNGRVHTGHLAGETFIDGWWMYDTYVDGGTYEGEIELGWDGEVIRGVRTSIMNSAIEYVSGRLGISADGFSMQNENVHDSNVSFSRTSDQPAEGQDCSCYASTPGYGVLGYHDEINIRSTGRISYTQQCVVEDITGEEYQVNNKPECTPEDTPSVNGMSIGSTKGLIFLAGMGEVLDQSDLPSPAFDNSVHGQTEVCNDGPSSPEDAWNVFINDLLTNTQAQQTARERSDPLFWMYSVTREDWMPPEGIIIFWSALGNYPMVAAYINFLRSMYSDYKPPFDEHLAVSPNLQMMDEIKAEMLNRVWGSNSRMNNIFNIFSL